MKNLISKCCGAEVRQVGTDVFLKPYIICNKCNDFCEVIEPKDEKEEVE